MRSQDHKRGHCINRNRQRQIGCQALCEERDSPFSFTTSGEEFSLGFLVSLGHEERRWTEAPPAFGTGVNLVVEQVLDMVDGQQVFTVHGDDDRVPYL